MNVISRGIRNAFRNSIRTFSIVIILGLSIGLALTMLMAGQAVQGQIGSVQSSIGNIINISPAGARGFEGGGEPLTGSQLTLVQSLPHVVSITKTLTARLAATDTNLQSAVDAGTLGNQAGQAFGGRRGGNFTPPITLVGTTDPTTIASAGGGTVSIIDGQNIDSTTDGNVAIIGSGLATKNSLSVGSTFQAYGKDITISGIFESGNRFSDNLVLMPLVAVQTLSAQPDDITSAVAQVDSITNLSSAEASIKTTLGDAADVVSQQDTATRALAPLDNIKHIALFSLVGAVVAGAIIVLLTMLMVVRERRREIGVLKAIGAPNWVVVFQFIVESVTLTLMGAVAGLVIGVIGGNPITKLLVSNSMTAPQSGMMGGFGGRGAGAFFGAIGNGANNLRTLHTSLNWSILLYGLAAALVIAIVGSAIPAWLTAKIRPAEVLRGE